MMLRLSFLFVILLFITHVSISQTKHHKTIQHSFSEYFKYLIQHDEKKAIDYIEPDFFSYVPKSQFLKSLSLLHHNDQFDYTLDHPVIDEIDEVTNINDVDYALVDYSVQIGIKFKIESLKELTIAQKEQLIRKSFGNKNVDRAIKYKKETDLFKYGDKSTLCAISKDHQKTWKFLLIDAKQKEILSKFLPEQIISKL